MKKNYLLTATMLIGTVLLAGCQSPTASTPQESTTESTVQESTTQQSEAQESTSQSLTEIESFYRTENIEELIEKVKFNEDGIYISWWNRDRDYHEGYRNSDTADTFYIISENPLNVDEISITLPVKSEYEIFVLEVPQEKLQHTTVTWGGLSPFWVGFPQGVLPDFLYETYRGINWKEMLDLYEPIAGLADDFVNRTEAQKKYREYQFKYSDDYLFSIDPTTFPKINCYCVDVRFNDNDLQNETFQTAEIKIGDKTYIQEIGEIRLDNTLDLLDSFETIATGKAREELILDSMNSAGFRKTTNYPGGEGIVKSTFFVGKVQENMTLERIYIYDETNAELLGANIKLSTKEQDGSLSFVNDVEMDLNWDCVTPIYITAGNYIQIDVIIKDPDMAKWEYGFSGTLILEYTGDEGDTYIQTAFLDISRQECANFWVTYAMLVNPEMRENIVRYYDYYRAEREEWRRVKFE